MGTLYPYTSPLARLLDPGSVETEFGRPALLTYIRYPLWDLYYDLSGFGRQSVRNSGGKTGFKLYALFQKA